MNSITTIFEWNITDQQAKKMFEDTDIRISAIVNNFSLQLEKGANETEWLVRRQIKFFVLQIHPYSTPYLCIPWRGFHLGGLKPPVRCIFSRRVTIQSEEEEEEEERSTLLGKFPR